MAILKITKQQARRFILAYQGLDHSFEFSGKQGILEFIRRVGCIQFDSLNIVGRNPELVLQSRIPDFTVCYWTDWIRKCPSTASRIGRISAVTGKWH